MSYSTLLCLLILVTTAEIFCRIYWAVQYKVPFWHPSRILYAFYPYLNTFRKNPPTQQDKFFNILIMGGSAMCKDWGEVEKYLSEKLARNGHTNIRIYNISGSGYTSRDLLLQYKNIDNCSFDLILIYPPGGDVRANNIDSEKFRENYSHYGRYELINQLASHHNTSFFSLQYSLKALLVGIKQKLLNQNYIPTHWPLEDCVQYGEVIKSKTPFRENVSEILEIAKERREKVILMTYTFYIPENYSRESFDKKILNYTLHIYPVELFGRKENVLNAFKLHNDVIRELDNEYNHVSLVDQEILMYNHPKYFNDPVHFTLSGSIQFVENILPRLNEEIQTTDCNTSS